VHKTTEGSTVTLIGAGQPATSAPDTPDATLGPAGGVTARGAA
jgi:hypothetical protein